MVDVSVIIPSYKGSNVLARALKSLVHQTFKNFEVIIVDDNGVNSDEQQKTQKIIGNFDKVINLKYFAHEINKNGAVARNTGLKMARGRYICFLDDDDVYLSGRLANAVETLDKHPEFDMVFCSVLIQRNNKLVQLVNPVLEDNVEMQLLLNTNLFGTGSNIFFRRKVYDDIGGFNEQYFRRQDNEFLLRALKDHSCTVINKLDIVKNNLGLNNIPSSQKLIQSNELYFKDFAYLIDSLPYQDKMEFFSNQMAWIYFCSLMKDDSKTQQKIKTDFVKYRPLTPKEKLQAFLSRLHLGRKSLLSVIHPLVARMKNTSKHKRNIKLLDDCIIQELHSFNII